ncbi:MAG: hypothetical protein DRJ66_05700 [Thermoprotei archaeon]|nr:MAG: hypothetical protein DRJ66_05700 [Thermoprotei archaeon]RLF20744.1 MAG: hypothetical protein DRZ82_01165 [Thermoprotei archaeon]
MTRIFKLEAMVIAKISTFAALYAVLTLALHPISYLVIQLRLSDALIPLSIVYGPEVAIGVCLGCVVANLFAPYGPNILDITLGSLANLIASYTAFRLRRRATLGCIVAAVIVGLIVGGYLWIITNVPPYVTITSVTISSLIAIGAIGRILVGIITKVLEEHGLRLR